MDEAVVLFIIVVAAVVVCGIVVCVHLKGTWDD